MKAISILSGKYKRFTFVHLVIVNAKKRLILSMNDNPFQMVDYLL